MRLALAALAPLLLLTSTTALAGGLGLVANGGAYQERVYYYNAAEQQFQQGQLIGMAGTGLEVVLGDKDDRIVGIARTYWQIETPERNPANNSNQPGIVANWREDARNVGVFAVGLQGGLIGQPDKGMLTVQGMIGSGFLTTDHQEYVFGDVGMGGTYRFAGNLEGYANLNGHLRFRKWARGGVSAAAGIRVLFD